MGRATHKYRLAQLDMDRRQALMRIGAAAAGALGAARPVPALPEGAGYHPLLMAESYIWLEEFRMNHRNSRDGVPEMCAGFRSAGFRRVELNADFLTPDLCAETMTQFRKNHLQIISVAADSTMHTPEEAQKSIAAITGLARYLLGKGLAFQAIMTDPRPRPDHTLKSAQELALQARSLDSLGAQLRALGVRLLIHHHTPELADHAREWRYELAHTDPNLVFCNVDVDWAVRGGQPPLPFIEACGKRLASLHLRNDKNGVWMENFAPGDIDYQPIAQYLRQTNYQGFLIVELAYEKATKVTRPLTEDLRLSRLYAEKVFGV